MKRTANHSSVTRDWDYWNRSWFLSLSAIAAKRHTYTSRGAISVAVRRVCHNIRSRYRISRFGSRVISAISQPFLNRHLNRARGGEIPEALERENSHSARDIGLKSSSAYGGINISPRNRNGSRTSRGLADDFAIAIDRVSANSSRARAETIPLRNCARDRERFILSTRLRRKAARVRATIFRL